jgi:predicted nucleic acid-binding protein
VPWLWLTGSMKTKRVVIDASYALSWLLPDENRPTLEPDHTVAPELLRYEVINALWSNVVRGRIGALMAKKLLYEFDGWQIQYQKIDMGEVLDLSIAYKLSGYDASYLYLAKKLKCKLLTWDKRLAEMAK